MRRVRVLPAVLSPALVLGLMSSASCGGASHDAVAPGNSAASASTAPAQAPASSSSQVPPPTIPTTCAEPSAPVCTPASAFVDRLCRHPHQEVALTLFAKTTPFARLYVRGALDELSTGEEVLALRFHGVPKGGMVVGSGAGTLDVLRWNGSCSMAVEAEVFTKTAPARARAARVQWHRIGDKMQAALIDESVAVQRAHSKRGKECKGAMTGDVSAACDKADAELGQAVVDYVRQGGALPTAEPP
jgi:hypothetical protein